MFMEVVLRVVGGAALETAAEQAENCDFAGNNVDEEDGRRV